MGILARLDAAGLVPAEPFRSPSGGQYPFQWVRVSGSRAFVSGHLPLNPDGTLAEPRGKVGGAVSPDDARTTARLAALAMLGSLHRAVGDLDRVEWQRVFGMVNVAPGFAAVAPVMNAFSELVVDLFGPERGAHARSVAGVAELPFDVCVEVEAEVRIS